MLPSLTSNCENFSDGRFRTPLCDRNIICASLTINTIDGRAPSQKAFLYCCYSEST